MTHLKKQNRKERNVDDIESILNSLSKANKNINNVSQTKEVIKI